MAGIGFFAPLPLALMMPFMAGQSLMMGDAFGKSYQYGKRKISAMSNEEFNKLTTADLAKGITTDYAQIIPQMKIAMAQSTEFQSLIIQEMGNIIKSLPAEITKFFGGEGTASSSTLEQIVIGLLTKALNLPSIPSASAESTPTTQPPPPPPPTEIQGPPTKPIPPGSVFNPPNITGPIKGENPKGSPFDVFKGTDKRHEELPKKMRAPKSIITQFNKLNEELRSLLTIKNRFKGKGYWVETQYPKLTTAIYKKMLSLYNKYDLTGKVNSSNYNYHTPLVDHH